MKRNAILRIIIWSIVIMVLLAILLTVMIGFRRRGITRYETAAATYAAVPLTTAPTEKSAIASADLTVLTSPSSESIKVGTVEAGSHVSISRREVVNGLDWAYISSPVPGWVLAESLNDAVPQETGVTVYLPEPGEKNSFHASEISEIKIEWVSGDILIQPGSSDQITVDEDGNFDEKYAMVLKQQGNELKISFCQDGFTNFIGINSTNNLSKDLTITVPVDWVCESLKIEAASATVEVNDLTIREVDFDGASGTCEFENCTVNEIDIDTASGDVKFIGSLDILDCDAASASVYAVLSNTPNRLDMDTMSGDLDITLPEDAGFALSLEAATKDFQTDFETTMKNGNYVCGDGSCRININALSGDVTIRKAAPATP